MVSQERGLLSRTRTVLGGGPCCTPPGGPRCALCGASLLPEVGDRGWTLFTTCHQALGLTHLPWFLA